MANVFVGVITAEYVGATYDSVAVGKDKVGILYRAVKVELGVGNTNGVGADAVNTPRV